jgi:predicted DNA-binding protein
MKETARKTKTQNTASVRASISFPPDVYKTLAVIAREKKVSVAWVVREAVDSYMENKWPLFAQKG